MRALLLLALGGCDGVFGLDKIDDVPLQPDAPPMPTDDALVYFPLDALDAGVTRDTVRGVEATCAPAQCPTTAMGQGLEFDGANDLLVVEGEPSLETTSALTVSAWVRQVQPLFAQGFGCFVNKRYGFDANTWQLCTRDDGTLNMFSFNGVGHDGLTTAWSNDVWHHVAIRWDGATKTLWVDGETRGSVTANMVFDGSALTIGADDDSGVLIGPFPGVIDDVRIYGRALDRTEILALAVR